MKSHRITWLLAALLVFGVIGWMARARRTPATKLVSPTSVAAATGAGVSARNPRTSIAADAPAAGVEAADRKQFIALVASRLREWEIDDDPELRDDRIASLDNLFSDGGHRPMAERLALIAALPPQLMDFAFGLPSFQQWMFAEPSAALDWIGLHRGISDARVLTLFQDWREHDSAAATHYVEQLAPGEWKDRVIVAASYAALPEQPLAVIEWAREMKPSAAQLGLLEMATTEWARRDAVAAGQWLSNVGDLSLQEELTSALAGGFADTDPQGAARWVLGSMLPGPALDRSIAEIAGAWAKQDPAAAAAWIAKFPAGGARQMALENLVSAWRVGDRSAALAWARALPDESFRRQAIELLGEAPTK